MRTIGRILVGGGALATLVALMFTWGSDIYWKLLGEFFQGPVTSFHAMPTVAAPDAATIAETPPGVPQIRPVVAVPTPSTLDVVILAIYVLFPLMILLASASSAIANKGYGGVLILAAIYLCSVLYTTFSDVFQQAGSPITRLGAAHTLLWFASVAGFLGGGLGMFHKKA